MLSPFGAVPNLDEIATLIVAGKRFDQWETVWVQHRFADAFAMFRFTAAEAIPGVQFKPADFCDIYLGYVQALRGIITSRQVAYDANNHAIQLEGKSRSWAAFRASAETPTNNLDGRTIEQATKEVLAPTGVPVETYKDSKFDEIPFPTLQIPKGIDCWHFLENLSRQKRCLLGSDPFGKILLIGNHTQPPSQGSLIEGVNILHCQFVRSIDGVFSYYKVAGQSTATNGHSGTAASDIEDGVPGSLPLYSMRLTPAETTVWDRGDVLDRARNESIWSEGSFIQAVVTVAGWKRPDGNIWQVGEDVYLNSPMCPWDGNLAVQTATFQQSANEGTTTTLECVPSWLLLGKSDYGGVALPSANPTDPAPTPAPEPPAPQPTIPPDPTTIPLIPSPF